MKLSLIIPAYKVEKYLSRCLESCIHQDISSDDYEIIVVDDGSPDQSGAIADSYAEKYHNIKVVHKKNGGLSSARNRGFEESTGDYVWFIDSDDWIKENGLSKVIISIDQYKPDAIRIGAENVDGGNREEFYSLQDMLIVSGKDTLLDMPLPCVPFFIWNRHLFEANNLKFVEGILHEDMEFTPRVMCMCDKVLNIADVMYYVFVNTSSITRSVNPKKSFDYVDHVCKSLYDFSRGLEIKYKRHFDYLIAMCINNAISNIDGENNEIVDQLNNSIRKHDAYINCFWTSQNFKYKLEFVLFKVFAPKYVQAFRVVDKLNRK